MKRRYYAKSQLTLHYAMRFVRSWAHLPRDWLEQAAATRTSPRRDGVSFGHSPAMTLLLAEQQAGRILIRERKEPTVRYRSLSSVPNGAPTIYSLTPHQWEFPRDSRPRKVRQNPEETELKGDNFDLLTSIYDGVPQGLRASFAKHIAMRIGRADSFHHRDGELRSAGTARQCSSELPLLAELLVRKHWKSLFLRALGDAAISPGLTLMLMQLEDMIAFNFALFSDTEYVQLSSVVAQLELRLTTFDPKCSNTQESNTVYHLKRELPSAFKNLKDVIDQAHVALIRQSSGLPESKRVQMQTSTPTISPVAQSRVIDVLPNLHEDLRDYAHYFREGKRKEAVSLLERLQPRPERMALIEKIFERVWEQKLDSRSNEASALRSQLEKLETKKKNVMEQMAAGSLAGDDFKTLYGSIRSELEDVRARLSIAESSELDLRTALDYLNYQFLNTNILWQESDIAGKSVCSSQFFRRGIVWSSEGFGNTRNVFHL